MDAPRPIQRGLLPVVLLAGLAAGCGIPGLPSLPASGSPPATVAWPGADSLARVAAAAPAPGVVGLPERGCFRAHLEEAIELNERRLPVYSRWTGGESEPISRQLIAAERRGLLGAWYVDRRARRYQAAGIPIACADFVPMAWTPPLGPEPDRPPEIPAPPAPDTDLLEARILEAYGAGGFQAVLYAIQPKLDLLHETPMYHCMVRHLLESVARIAALAPLHEAAAARAGLPSAVPISELLLRMHLAVLREAGDLDRMAEPLQARGVPIVCGDVPPIPYPRL